MPNATVRAKARTTPKPPTPTEDIVNILKEEIGLAARRRAGEEAAVGDDEYCAHQQAFSRAYARWLRACAQIEDPGTDDEQIIKTFFDEERAAQRAVFLIPAVCREDLWNKLEVFEVDLAREQVVGPHKDSILMLALGSIKADLMNLGVGEEV